MSTEGLVLASLRIVLAIQLEEIIDLSAHGVFLLKCESTHTSMGDGTVPMTPPTRVGVLLPLQRVLTPQLTFSSSWRGGIAITHRRHCLEIVTGALAVNSLMHEPIFVASSMRLENWRLSIATCSTPLYPQEAWLPIPIPQAKVLAGS